MSLDGRLGASMQVESFLRLGIGVVIAAFHTRGVASRPIERRAIAFSFVRRFAMKPKRVLPVHGVEVLSDGRFIRPIPTASTLTSEHAGWDGVPLEYHCNVPACDIAEHEHPTHLLNLLVGEPVRAEWTTEGRCRSAINEPGTIYLLPRGTRDKVAWTHQSSRVLLAIDAKFLAQSVEETAHLEDVALTPDWELKDRHIAALMMALHADLEDGQPAGPL